MSDYDFDAVDLERGAELLDECGWIQQDNGNRQKGFCAVEAVREAAFERVGARMISIGEPLSELLGLTGYVSRAPYVHRGLSGQLRWTTTMQSHGIAGYNDAIGRTKEEVQDLLMEGAKKLRELGQ